MGGKEGSIRLSCLSVLVVLVASTASVASAQTQIVPTPDDVLTPGMTVWITDTSGREEKAQIGSVSGGTIIVVAAERSRRLSSVDITRIRARHSDSVLNGALIGAAAGVGSGLLLCSLTEPWEFCRGDEGSMLRIGALGAGIGIGVDLLIRGRKTIYQAPGRSAGVHIAPLIGRAAAGVQVAFRFE
jgi:hypothetical protein